MSILSQAKPLPYWIVLACSCGHLSDPVYHPDLVPTACPRCKASS